MLSETVKGRMKRSMRASLRLFRHRSTQYGWGCHGTLTRRGKVGKRGREEGKLRVKL